LISKNTIDTVFETARVEEVIGDFVQLKKSGSNYKGLSPFSEERTPSFMVSPVKQIWKDFSSGKGGNVVAFLMEHEHFTYPEAIRYLAKRYGIEIEETEQTSEEKEAQNEKESLYLVSEFAKTYFHQSLLKSEEGKAIGLTYFKERGFTPETIEKFQLGYSPESWDAFSKEALGKGYKLEFLEKTGLTIVKESTADATANKFFDRFKGRVMFPILSMSGRTLGFGGRILTNDKKAAKYLNSPESIIYNKSKVLYGIYHAKQAIAKENNCYLVEGYTDVIQLFQKGVENVVSSSGTALTTEQIRLINRLTNNITLLFDGDAAGLRAAIRGVDLILEQGMNVRICTFPEGEDPDSFAKNNSLEEVVLYLEQNAKDFINFKASMLIDESKHDPIKKAETIREIVTSVSKIPDAIKRELYIRECSRIMDVSEEVLFSTLVQLHSKEKRDRRRQESASEKPFEVHSQRQTPTEKIDVKAMLEEKILEILLLYGNREEEFEDMHIKLDEHGHIELVPEKMKAKVYEKIYLDLQEDEVQFSNPFFTEIFTEIIEKYNTNPNFKVEEYINQLESKKAQKVADVFMEDERYQLHDWERKEVYVKQKADVVAQQLSEVILRLRELLIASKIKELANQITQKEAGERQEILENIQEYNKLKVLLSERLKTVVRRVE
jgi:DNA primase